MSVTLTPEQTPETPLGNTPTLSPEEAAVSSDLKTMAREARMGAEDEIVSLEEQHDLPAVEAQERDPQPPTSQVTGTVAEHPEVPEENKLYLGKQGGDKTEAARSLLSQLPETPMAPAPVATAEAPADQAPATKPAKKKPWYKFW